jgi:hypothetical protein
MKATLDGTIIGLIQGEIDMTILRPLLLGGAQGPAGGVGGPPGGFIGYLPQWRVSYDESEQGTTWTVGSGIPPSGLIWHSTCLPSGLSPRAGIWPSGYCAPTLWDNLNHIRARISALEASGGGGGLSAINVELNGVPEGSGNTLNFIEGSNVAIAVTDMGDVVDVQISCTCSGVTASGLIVHNHQNAAEGGQLDHGLALTAASLLDDDHPQYIKDSEYTAKGDVLAGTGAGTFAVETLGSDYQFLMADSNEANGIKWNAAPKWANVVVVAKTGGDYTTVTAALAAIVDAAADNRYVILVAPDIGGETVTLKSYVDIHGFGTRNPASGVEGLKVTGSPTNVCISNMYLGGTLAAAGPTGVIYLTGGSVDFHHCRIYGTYPDATWLSMVNLWGGGTYRFYGCEITCAPTGSANLHCVVVGTCTAYFHNCTIIITGSDLLAPAIYLPSTGTGNTAYILQGTRAIATYADALKCEVGTAIVDHAYLSGGQYGIYLPTGSTATVNVYGSPVIVGGTNSINRIAGTVNIYSATLDPDTISGTVVGADKDLVVGDLAVLNSARMMARGGYLAWDYITSTELSGSASSVTFSSIPQTYRHLVLLISGRSDYADEHDDMCWRANGDSGGNYDDVFMTCYESDIFTCQGSRGRSSVRFGSCEGNNARASCYSPTITYFLNYCASSMERYSATSVSGMFRNRGSDDDLRFKQFIGAWRSTSAITSLTVYPNAGTNFVSGTKLALYGVA